MLPTPAKQVIGCECLESGFLVRDLLLFAFSCFHDAVARDEPCADKMADATVGDRRLRSDSYTFKQNDQRQQWY